jgi:uncharacterized protein (TIGR02271 family)
MKRIGGDFMARGYTYHNERNYTSRTVLKGVAIGGILGMVAAMANNFGIFSFSGLGLILRSYPGNAYLVITVLGAITGGLIGSLVSSNTLYEQESTGTNSTIINNAGKKQADLKNETEKIQILEEQLKVAKRWVQTGKVTVQKEVLTEEKTIKVPVKSEVLVIRNKKIDTGNIGTTENNIQVIRIPLREEHIDIRKYFVNLENVKVYKRQFKEIEHISETLKKERLKVDIIGDPKVVDSEPKKED